MGDQRLQIQRAIVHRVQRGSPVVVVGKHAIFRVPRADQRRLPPHHLRQKRSGKRHIAGRIAEHHGPPAAPGMLTSAKQCGRHARGFHRHVHPAAAGVLIDRLGGVRRIAVIHALKAERSRQFQFGRVDVEKDRRRGAHHPGPLRDHQPDRAQAENRQCFTGRHRRPPERVQRHRRGLGHRRFLHRHPVRDAHQVARRRDHVLAKGPVAARAEIVVTFRLGVMPFLGSGMIVAPDQRKHRHAIARRKIFHGLAARLDHPGHLVAANGRKAIRALGKTPRNVRPANATIRDANAHRALAQLGLRHGLVAKVIDSVKRNGAHKRKNPLFC